jgi:hypothetical protein
MDYEQALKSNKVSRTEDSHAELKRYDEFSEVDRMQKRGSGQDRANIIDSLSKADTNKGIYKNSKSGLNS